MKLKISSLSHRSCRQDQGVSCNTCSSYGFCVGFDTILCDFSNCQKLNAFVRKFGTPFLCDFSNWQKPNTFVRKFGTPFLCDFSNWQKPNTFVRKFGTPFLCDFSNWQKPNTFVRKFGTPLLCDFSSWQKPKHVHKQIWMCWVLTQQWLWSEVSGLQTCGGWFVSELNDGSGVCGPWCAQHQHWLYNSHVRRRFGKGPHNWQIDPHL